MSAINFPSFSAFPRYFSLERSEEKTNSPWQQVIAHRLKKDGSFFTDKKGNIQDYIYTLDNRTGELYCGGHRADDSAEIIKSKCMKIFLVAPLFAVGYIVFNFSISLVKSATIAFKTLAKFGHQLYIKKTTKAFEVLSNGFLWEIPKVNLHHLEEIIRIPFLCIAIQAAALYGRCKNPYEGRKWEAKFENIWQHNVSWKKDLKMVDHWKDAEACYIGQCFQVRAHISDPNLRVIKKGNFL